MYKTSHFPNPKLHIIDYLKAICIIFVIIDHSGYLTSIDPLYLFMVRMAVPIFILLSGYNYTISHSKQSVPKLYEPGTVFKRILRYTFPAIVTYCVYLSLLIINGSTLNPSTIFLSFLMGQYGLGAYYLNILLEFIFLFPLLYYCIKQWNEIGIMFIAFFNLIYELSCVTYNMDSSIYRILIFRYLFLIALGIYLYLNKDKTINKSILIVMFIVGIIYLLMPNHLGYSYRIFINWSNTSMMVGFYIFPVIYFILREFHAILLPDKVDKLLTLIGRASYHIMYTQMIFYLIKDKLYSIIYDFSCLGPVIDTMFAIGFSLLSGIIFYLFNRWLFKILNI